MQIDEDVQKVLNENYIGPGGGEYFSKSFPEGEVYVDWNTGEIVFDCQRDDLWLTLYAPDPEYRNQFEFSIGTDGGDYVIDVTELGTTYREAKAKMTDLIAKEPKAAAFVGLDIPKEAIHLLVKWCNLKDLGISFKIAMQLMNTEYDIENVYSIIKRIEELEEAKYNIKEALSNGTLQEVSKTLSYVEHLATDIMRYAEMSKLQ